MDPKLLWFVRGDGNVAYAQVVQLMVLLQNEQVHQRWLIMTSRRSKIMSREAVYCWRSLPKTTKTAKSAKHAKAGCRQEFLALAGRPLAFRAGLHVVMILVFAN